MRKVTERHGYEIDGDGFIHYDDQPSTYESAEKIAGIKLDRRKNYAIIDGEVCESCTFSRACSGCTNDMSERGIGCHECGYTGRSITSSWIPLMI